MSQADGKLVTEVVDRLKKQGLFDKFRKECLADVDTKPAYQNLTHRVEVAVSRFLSAQKWRPDLNKNQLRENLRRHLNELPMLSTGVDRVVDQVVNPKIYKDFKPQIDRVVCDHLGLDYDKWIARLNPSESTGTEEDAQQIASGMLIPSLMDLDVIPPPRGSSASASDPASRSSGITVQTPLPAPSSVSTLAMSLPLGSVVAAAGITGMPDVSVPPPLPPGHRILADLPPIPTVLSNLPPSTLPPPSLPPPPTLPPPPVLPPPPTLPPPPVLPPPPTLPPHPLPPPPTLPPPSLPPPPTLPPPSLPPMPPLPSGLPIGVGLTVGMMSAYSQVPPGMSSLPYDPDQPPPHSGFYPHYPSTLYSSHYQTQLPGGLGIGAPMSIPLRTMDVDITSGVVMSPSEVPVHQETDTEKDRKRRRKKKEVEPLTVESLLNVSHLISAPQEPKQKDAAAKSSDEPAKKSDKVHEAEMNNQEYQGSEEATEKRSEAAESHAVEEMEVDEEEKRLTPKESSKKYHFSWEAIDAGDLSDVAISSVHTSDLSSFDEDDNYDSDADKRSSDEDERRSSKDINVDDGQVDMKGEDPKKEERDSDIVTSKRAVAKQQKTGRAQRLIALQYNYSDSENEETREERKARIAEEKADRYLRRQQRRAELESKHQQKTKKTSARERIPVQKSSSKKVSQKVESEQQKSETISEKESVELSPKDVTTDAAERESMLPKPGPSDAKPTPRRSRQRRTKEQLKEELREIKVMEKKRELRRQRTLNRKYLSEDFTSIFTENRDLLSSSGYMVQVEEEEVVVESDEPSERRRFELSESSATNDTSEAADRQEGVVLEETVIEESVSSVDLLVPKKETEVEVPCENAERSSPYSNISEDSCSMDSVIVVDVKPAEKEREQAHKSRRAVAEASAPRRSEKRRRSPSQSNSKSRENNEVVVARSQASGHESGHERDRASRHRSSSSRHRHSSASEDTERRATPPPSVPSSDVAREHQEQRESESGYRESDNDSRGSRSQFEAADASEDRSSKKPIDDVNFGEAAKRAAKRYDDVPSVVRRSRGSESDRRRNWQHFGDAPSSSSDARVRTDTYRRRSPVYPTPLPDDLPYRAGSGHQGSSWPHEPADKGSYASRSKSKDVPETRERRDSRAGHSSSLDDDRSTARSSVPGSPGRSKKHDSRSRSPPHLNERLKPGSRSKRARSPGEMSSSSDDDSSCSRPRSSAKDDPPLHNSAWEGSLPHSRLQHPYPPVPIEGRPMRMPPHMTMDDMPRRLPKPPQLPPFPGRDIPRSQRHHRGSFPGPPRPMHHPLPPPPTARELSPMAIRTRAGQRRSEEDNAPIAKRLRR